MHLDPGNIADYLEDLAAADGDKEGPCAGVNTEEYLEDEDEGEKDEVEGVADEGRVVLHLAPGKGAGLEGTEGGVVEEGCVHVGGGGGVVHGDWLEQRKCGGRMEKGEKREEELSAGRWFR